MQTQASATVTLGMLVISLLPLALIPWALRRAAPEWVTPSVWALGAWYALWAGLAVAGILGEFDWRPPPIALLVFASVVAGFWLGLSPVGARLAGALPLWLLVLSQGFRFPLELVMHQAALERVMPAALSFGGYNFDIVTGASAFLVAFWLRRGGSARLAWLWNVYGSACLVAIALIAVVTSPMLAALGPQQVNSWIARFPFVWLPSALVAFAIAGQIVVFRKLGALASPLHAPAGAGRSVPLARAMNAP